MAAISTGSKRPLSETGHYLNDIILTPITDDGQFLPQETDEDRARAAILELKKVPPANTPVHAIVDGVLKQKGFPAIKHRVAVLSVCLCLADRELEKALATGRLKDSLDLMRTVYGGMMQVPDSIPDRVCAALRAVVVRSASNAIAVFDPVVLVAAALSVVKRHLAIDHVAEFAVHTDSNSFGFFVLGVEKNVNAAAQAVAQQNRFDEDLEAWAKPGSPASTALALAALVTGIRDAMLAAARAGDAVELAEPDLFADNVFSSPVRTSCSSPKKPRYNAATLATHDKDSAQNPPRRGATPDQHRAYKGVSMPFDVDELIRALQCFYTGKFHTIDVVAREQWAKTDVIQKIQRFIQEDKINYSNGTPANKHNRRWTENCGSARLLFITPHMCANTVVHAISGDGAVGSKFKVSKERLAEVTAFFTEKTSGLTAQIIGEYVPRGIEQAAFVNKIVSMFILVGVSVQQDPDEHDHALFVVVDYVHAYYKENSAKKSPGRGIYALRSNKVYLANVTSGIHAQMMQKFKQVKKANYNFKSPEAMLSHVFEDSVPLFSGGKNIRLDTLQQGINYGLSQMLSEGCVIEDMRESASPFFEDSATGIVDSIIRNHLLIGNTSEVLGMQHALKAVMQENMTREDRRALKRDDFASYHPNRDMFNTSTRTVAVAFYNAISPKVRRQNSQAQASNDDLSSIFPGLEEEEQEGGP